MSVEIIFSIRNKEYDKSEINNFDDFHKLPIIFWFTKNSIAGSIISDYVDWDKFTIVDHSMIEDWKESLKDKKQELIEEAEKFDKCMKYETNYVDRLEIIDLQREVLDDIRYIDKAIIKLNILDNIVSINCNEVIIEVSY